MNCAPFSYRMMEIMRKEGIHKMIAELTDDVDRIASAIVSRGWSL